MSERRDRVEVFTAASWMHVDQRPVYHWSYISSNGRILANGDKGYAQRVDAIKGARRVTGVDLSNVPDFIQEIEGQAREVWEICR